MNTLSIISLIALAFCITLCLCHFFRLIKLGKPKDLSQPSGNIVKGIAYSNTVAMMPNHKESAYKHIPTYAAGMIYHLGTFLSLLLFLLLFIGPVMEFMSNKYISLVIGICLSISSIFGIILFIKRLISKELKPLSNIDDYISNGLTTLFQISGAMLFLSISYLSFSNPFVALLTLNKLATILSVYYIVSTILFLYLPFGKLKHVVYYFAARYQLGFFYGWRNTWPQKNID